MSMRLLMPNQFQSGWNGDYVKFKAKKGDELTITYPLIEFNQEVKGLWKGRPDSKLNLQMARQHGCEC